MDFVKTGINEAVMEPSANQAGKRFWEFIGKVISVTAAVVSK